MPRLRILISRGRADAFLLSRLTDIRYLCGFTGSNALLVVDDGGVVLFTDSRYAVQAHEEVAGARIRITRKPLWAEAGAYVGRARQRPTVLFAPDSLSVGQFEQARAASGNRVTWRRSGNLVGDLRRAKDEGEIAEMRLAAQIVSDVFEGLLPLIRPGIRESELAAEVEYRMRRKGATGPSFETIIASGPRSALPHARPTEKRIAKNELVVLDLGAILRGYCSDMTRTVFVGRAPKRVRAWYGAVREAQAAAVDILAAGVTAGGVDARARRVLRTHRLDRFFTHSTGHGLGLEVHEPPRLGRGEKTVLAAGNVVTVEPGVYVEGIGGIRIEDDVVIREDGAEVLTKAPKEFLEL